MFEHIRAGAGIAAAVAIFTVIGAPVDAQTHRAAIGVTGGWSHYGNLTPGLSNSSVFEAGWIAGGQAEVWIGAGRFGARLNGSYTQRPLESDPQATYDLLAGDLSLMGRPLPAGLIPYVAPYVALGGGLAQFRDAGAMAPVGGGAYGADPVTRPTFVAAVGVDALPSSPFGLRVEFADQVVFPSAGESPPYSGLPATHNLRVLTALQYRIGGARVPRAVAATDRSLDPDARRPAQSGSSDVERLRQELADRDRTIAALQAELDSVRAELAGASGAQQQPAAPAEPTPTPRAESRSRGAPLGSPATEAPARTTPARPAAEPEVDTSADADARFTVQVGSFVEPATAGRWMERLREGGVPAWLRRADLQGLDVVRVRVGATTTRADADSLARLLSDQFGWSVRVDELEDGDDIPAGAVARTLMVISGG